MILDVERDGKLAIHKGLLKPDDAKALKRAKANGEEPPEPAKTSPKPQGVTLSAPVIEELTAIRTMAMRCELARRPDLALAVIVHDLALPTFFGPWTQGHKLTQIEPKATDAASLAGGEGNKAVASMKETLDGWAARLPAETDDLWPWLIVQERSILLDLLAVMLAGSLDLVRYRHEKAIPSRIVSGDRLATALTLDMTRWWQADAALLSRISKADILAALSECVSPKIDDPSPARSRIFSSSMKSPSRVTDPSQAFSILRGLRKDAQPAHRRPVCAKPITSLASCSSRAIHMLRMAADYALEIKTPMHLAKQFGAPIYNSAREFARTHQRACVVYVLGPIEYVEGYGARALVRRIEPSPAFAAQFGCPADAAITLDHPLRPVEIHREFITAAAR